MDTFTITDVLQNLRFVLPEIALCGTILAIILFDLLLRPEQSYKTGILALAGLIAVTYFVLEGYALESGPVFMGMLKIDRFGCFFKLLFVSATFLTVVYSLYHRELNRYKTGEYYAILLTATLGMCLLASSKDFLMFYLSIETLSLSAYVLTGYTKQERVSNEAAVKYLVYGAAASGVMLFGISYIYGMTGTLDIEHILNVSMGNSTTLFAALLLVMVGLGFKAALVPFHFWCPDVYQGAPTPVTAYLSVASKAAGFVAIFRVFTPYFDLGALPATAAVVAAKINIPMLFYVLSIVTMTFGNLVAIRQSNIKRLLAYSSIAHAGYILMGFAVFSTSALEAMLFYLAVYLIMNLAAFLIVITLENSLGSAEIKDYRGIIKQMPFLVTALFITLISLTGIPPTAGFWAKLKLLLMLLETGRWLYYSLALVAVANTVVSLWYYMKIIKTMVFDTREETDPEPGRLSWVDIGLILIIVAPLLLLFLDADPLTRLVRLSLL